MGQIKLPLWAASTHISCSGSYLCQLLLEVCEKNTAKAKEGLVIRKKKFGDHTDKNWETAGTGES